jgi:phenylacetic acid degradation operon negative regulatory protein
VAARASTIPGRLPAAVSAITDTERPLTARSVIASTLLGVDPPRLPTRLLVRSGELFGIAQGTTRVALSRLAGSGALEPDGDGYRLAGTLLGRQTRQSLSRAGTTRAWRGAWVVEVVVVGDRRTSERAALRTAATALRLAERREGVWMRPDNLPPSHQASLPDAHAVLLAQCERALARPDRDDAALAGDLWDLPTWAGRGRALLAAVGALQPRLAGGAVEVLGPAFVVSAAVLRHFQADPLLPIELLPADWPGAELRAAYERYDATFKDAWRAWFQTQH